MKVHKENKGLAKPLVERLKNEFMMSQVDIAKWCNVNKCVVSNWLSGKCIANTEHLNRLREIPLLLAGRNVKYRGQALDILMGRE